VAGGDGLFGQEHDYRNLGIENPNVRRSGIELVAGSGVNYLESEDFLKRKSPVFSSMDKNKSMNIIKILINQPSYPDAERSPSKSPEKERSQFKHSPSPIGGKYLGGSAVMGGLIGEKIETRRMSMQRAS
jgi:hypothetical protein